MADGDGLDIEPITEAVGRKVGPLPVWAWATIAAVGVAAAIVIRRRLAAQRQQPAPPEPENDADGDGFADVLTGTSPFMPGGFVVGGPGGGVQGTGSTGDNSTGAEPVDTVPSTNADWERAAARYLIARGFQGTIVVDALGSFLSGGTLTTQGQAMIDAAIAAIGAPPQPVPPPRRSPTPEPDPSPGGGGGGTTNPPPVRSPAPRPGVRYVIIYNWQDARGTWQYQTLPEADTPPRGYRDALAAGRKTTTHKQSDPNQRR